MKKLLSAVAFLIFGIELAIPRQSTLPTCTPTPSLCSQQAFAAQPPEREEEQAPESGLPVIREQEEPRPPERPPPAAEKSSSSPRPYKASELKGRKIKSVAGEDLGEVEDVLIGTDGRVEFVLVSYGGFFELGGKLVAVPYSALRQDPEQEVFVVSFAKKKMDQAPAFQDGQWPDFYTEEWRRELRSYYGE